METKNIKVKNSDREIEVSADKVKDGTVFYDVRKEPFELYGLYNPKTEPEFKRMPDEAAAKVSGNISYLARHTSGGRVRFSTDSEFINIRAYMYSIDKMAHFPLTGSAGFSLYIDTPDLGGCGDSKFVKTFVPPFDISDGYTGRIEFGSKKLRYITIYFPTYSGVSDLFVGVSEDAVIGEGMKYRDVAPTVYYGSSITQGGCVCQPGNTYQAIISRRLGMDFINLGFSGSAKGEDAMAEYLAGLDMSAFVSAYDHNNNVQGLEETHYKLYRRIRDAHPDIPYIILSRADFDANYNESILRRDVIYKTYITARNEGDTNVYFIDGAGIFRGRYEDACTMDGVHFNDLGFMLTADSVEAELRRSMQIKPF